VGSELEGDWARRCITIMEQYRDSLTAYDQSEKVPLTDVRKLAGWYKTIGDKISHKRVMSEVTDRAKKA